MLGSLNSAITGMDAASEGMNVIGNNIANVNTAAFKGGSISFASIYSDSVSILGGHSGNEEGKGVQVVALSSVWEQGALESTMNPTDMALQGDGFFQVVENGANTYYTRAGQFRYDQDYRLTDPNGRVVQGFAFDAAGVLDTTVNVPIDIDETTYTDIRIESDGIITGDDGTGTRFDLYQVAIFGFPNIDGLKKVSGSLYEESSDSGAPLYATGSIAGTNGAGEIHNNHLEMSNVDLAREFVDLIVIQKAFQANSRVISSSADMLTEVINIIR